jgi:hypothetical protein
LKIRVADGHFGIPLSFCEIHPALPQPQTVRARCIPTPPPRRTAQPTRDKLIKRWRFKAQKMQAMQVF